LIKLFLCPPFRDDWTEVSIAGEHEEEVTNILVSRLLSLNYEVEDEDGTPFEEIES
jgi:hypothetical protein